MIDQNNLSAMTDNELALVVEKTGLDKPQVNNLMESFAGFFQNARQLVDQCKDIAVTDESQKEEMAKAKEFRGKLRDIRLATEETRVKLKEQSLREGRAIDGISNIIKALIIPIEQNLEMQEKFAENKEKERIEKQFVERVNKLSQYVSDVSLYNIKEMADEVFENLLSGCKSSWEKAQAEIKEAEERDRLEKERWEDFRRKQIEVAPYIEFMESELTQDMPDGIYQIVLSKAKEKKKIYDDKQEKIRLDNIELQKKVNEEKEKREQAEEKARQEKEAQAQKEADEKAEVEAKIKADEEIARKALLAPDKEKLLLLANKLDTPNLPAVSSRDAQVILEKVEISLFQISEMIREEAKKL